VGDANQRGLFPSQPRTDSHAAQKQAIGRAAAQYIDDGDTIIIDCGSTTLQLLHYLGSKQVTIITNSIPASVLAGKNSAVKLIYAPGEYSPDSAGMIGPLTVDFFHTLRVDKAFLGAHGFDAVGGANEPVLGDGTAKRAMLESAARSYLLVDSSKYGNVHFMALSKLSDFSCVITDDDFPAGKRSELEAACNEVIYA
jgi:DeoR/GlpR family transcriptional regulator of sugar metabolism